MKSLYYLSLVCILVSYANQMEINSNSKLNTFVNRFTKEAHAKVEQIKGDFTDCNSSTTTMIKKVVEDAALYYGNDVFGNIKYILSKINSPPQNWDLVILTNANVTSAFSKFTTKVTNCMLVSTKFNFYSPSWAYMFRSYVKSGQQYLKTSDNSYGSGFSSSDVQRLQQIIDRLSTQYPDDLQEQSQLMSQALGRTFNVPVEVLVSKTNIKSFAAVNVKNDKWLSYINKNVDLNYIVYFRDQ